MLNRSRWLLALTGLSLLLVSGGLARLGSRTEAAVVSVVGGNTPLNAGATSKADINANNSPSIAVNSADPANLAVANRIDTPRFSCALHVSVDGGSTWQPTAVPFPEGEELPPRCFAPDVAFDGAGTLFVSYATLKGAGNVPNAIWLARSDDGGRTLEPPRQVLGPLAFQVRLVADPAHEGRLHLTWLQAESVGNLQLPTTGNPILFARSDDGGETWQGPVRVSDQNRERVVAPSLALGPGGLLHVLYLDVGDDALDYHGGHQGQGGPPYDGRWQLVVATSRDRGGTWNETVVADDVVPVERFLVFLPPFPSIAVDHSDGGVYVSFHDGRSGDADVLLWASVDGARTFSAPRRVNDTIPRDGTSQYLPRLGVAPSARVDVLYYDRRADPDDVENEVSLQSSFDGGRSFTRRTRVSEVAFDSRIGFGAERGMPDLGNRLAIVSVNRRALAVWTDTRAGTAVSRKQDLSAAILAIAPPVPARAPLQAAAAVLCVAGIAVMGGSVRWRSSRRAEIQSDALKDQDPLDADHS